MQLTPAQSKIVSDTHRFRVVNCGRQFGKTTCAVEEMKACAVSASGKNVAYIATTYQQAHDIAWKTLVDSLAPVTVKTNETKMELLIRAQGGGTSRLVLRGWESVETLRGQKFDFIVVDEVAMMRNFQEGWMEVLRPTLTHTNGQVLFISTPKGFNHFYDLYNTNDPDFASFHFTTYDNPHAKREEIEAAKRIMPESQFEQEYMASFKKTQGLVYQEFDRDKHLFNDDEELEIRDVEKIAGIDFGFTHPTSVLTIKRDKDSNYWVTNEWFKTKQTDVQVAEYVASEGFHKVYPDPESPSAIQELKNRGVNVREVIKNRDSVKSGIDKVRELLLTGRLKVHKRCVNLIQEFETYAYPDTMNNKNDENPLKENDDALDSLRYAIMMDVPNSKFINKTAVQFYPTRRR